MILLRLRLNESVYLKQQFTFFVTAVKHNNALDIEWTTPKFIISKVLEW